jgi:hypothetical protein
VAARPGAADNRAGPFSAQAKQAVTMIHPVPAGARRRGVLDAFAAPAALVFSLLLPSLHTAAAAAGGIAGPLELVGRIKAGPTCTRPQVLGLCDCGGVPCGYRVLMHVPVAFVETVRAPGDSLLDALPGLATPEAAGTGSSRQSGLDNTAEAHAWLLQDRAWTWIAQPPCLTCRPSDALQPPPPAAPVPGCGLDMEPAAQGQPLPAWSPVLSALAYASEFDALNWRTGCRDLQRAALPGADLAGSLGGWGSLYPRQMRDLGTSPVVYSAKSAYRALSIAREQLGTFGAPVDLAARMQQAYPAVSACFGVGEQPLPELARSPQPVRASADGRYGWFYWRPVTCCVDFASLAQCPAR